MAKRLKIPKGQAETVNPLIRQFGDTKGGNQKAYKSKTDFLISWFFNLTTTFRVPSEGCLQRPTRLAIYFGFLYLMLIGIYLERKTKKRN
jgi:hypothetical protein